MVGRRRSLAVAVALVVGSSWPSSAEADGPAAPLRYHFTAGERVVYAVTITTDLPDGTQTVDGHAIYTVRAVDPANGQVTVAAESAFATRRTVTDAGGRGPFPPRPSFGQNVNGSGQVVVDASGNVLSTRGESQLPFLLGPLPRLALEPVPAEPKADWQDQRTVQVQELLGNGMFPSPFARRQHEDHAATETDTYHVTATDGDATTVHKKYELVTAEKSGDQPLLKQSGEGDFTFDAKAGRVRSLEEKQTITVRRDNVTVDVPTTVKVTLMGADEARQFLADRDAAAAKWQAEAARRGAEARVAEAAAATTEKTDLVGGKGGGPFEKLGTGADPVVGVWYTLGDWGGKGCVREVEPIYDRTATAPDSMDGAKSVLARDGYVVAGAQVGRDQTNATGFRIVFCRYKDGKIVLTDKYTSPLIGFAGNRATKQLGLDGRTVVGLCGRKGINVDAFGLVVAKADDAAADDGKPDPAKAKGAGPGK